jgi:CRISPR/Cas system-associated exonuclease Cas4 (RecB family)
MNQSDKKPQLHVSMIDQFARCGIQFQRRYGYRFGIWDREEIIPPGVALVTGIAVHKAVEDNLKNKLATGALLPTQQVQDSARDAVNGLWAEGVLLTEEEALDSKGALGSTVDQTVALATLHHQIVAPKIEPAAIEERFVISLKNYPFDLSGKKDVREKSGCLRDTKTAAATPPQDAARTMQNAMYSLAEKVERGAYPDTVTLDYLIKTKTPKYEARIVKPDDAFVQPLLRRVERVTEIIESVKAGKQALMPADPSNWACSAKYCGYARTCPFWSGR